MSAKGRQSQRDRDAAYRRALGLTDGQPIPNAIGAAESSGSARGGKGRSRSKRAKSRRARNAKLT